MWPYPTVIAHRGGGKLAPENTLAAMRCGLAFGFQGVEFDVMLAADAVPVVMHDPRLGRTVAGRGRVAEYTAAQLMAMDAGAWFDAAFAGEPVPTYEQVHQFCSQHRLWMNVEIKPAPGADEQTGRVVAEMTTRLCAADGALPLLSSFSLPALLAAKKAAPGIPRACLFDVIPADWQARLTLAGAVALHTNHRHLSRTQAQAVKKAGFGLFCYTVNTPARAREILSWGVDAFCTDRLDLIDPGTRAE
ncbi:MAG: glycerophosphodiester phosphodiesterase [Pseudomonadota bacterium]